MNDEAISSPVTEFRGSFGGRVFPHHTIKPLFSDNVIRKYLPWQGKAGTEAVEEQARFELGLVKKDEIFVEIPRK